MSNKCYYCGVPHQSREITCSYRCLFLLATNGNKSSTTNFRSFEEFDKELNHWIRGEFIGWILSLYSFKLPIEDLVASNYLIRNFTQKYWRSEDEEI